MNEPKSNSQPLILSKKNPTGAVIVKGVYNTAIVKTNKRIPFTLTVDFPTQATKETEPAFYFGVGDFVWEIIGVCEHMPLTFMLGIHANDVIEFSVTFQNRAI